MLCSTTPTTGESNESTVCTVFATIHLRSWAQLLGAMLMNKLASADACSSLQCNDPILTQTASMMFILLRV